MGHRHRWQGPASEEGSASEAAVHARVTCPPPCYWFFLSCGSVLGAALWRALARSVRVFSHSWRHRINDFRWCLWCVAPQRTLSFDFLVGLARAVPGGLRVRRSRVGTPAGSLRARSAPSSARKIRSTQGVEFLAWRAGRTSPRAAAVIPISLPYQLSGARQPGGLLPVVVGRRPCRHKRPGR